ncbi:High-affinity methionine permease [Vanrija pseudolonga]|uniref:High-affinity methionine permease n=1 Tax=Vanrija pseudolonga TaxID=143232 RepID=A0AAF1BP13_9TREE|nr:High-affinity methionine permease [Vanrija pseudolonga]
MPQQHQDDVSEKSDIGEVDQHAVPTLDKRQFVIKGDLQYVGESGHNNAEVTYQNVDGAPVEVTNPLGYHVGWWTAFFLNVSMIIGTGIFSTPSTILRGTGSVGLSLIYWVLGYLITLAEISVFLELAFPKPQYFFPVAFAVQTVILQFMSSNGFVLASYIFKLSNRAPKDWELKGVAIAGLTVVAIVVVANNRFALGLINVLGWIKIATLLFITFTGFAVLGGAFKNIPHPTANFHNSFEGTSSDGYSISNALVSIIFSYGGSTNSFNFTNEVKNPIGTIKRTAFGAVSVVFVLYFLVNVAYFAALPKATILKSSQITASLYFQTLFGAQAAKGLTIFPILSAFGNLTAALIGHSRMVREIGRQGVLPWPKFWVTTRPFGTPAAGVLVTWFVSVIFVLIPPAGNAFNFVIALQNYPSSFYLALTTIGLFFIRRQRTRLGLPRTEYRGWTFVAIFYVLANVFLLIMPWVPPKAGINASAFGFFYAASSLVGLGFIVIAFLYYVLWIKVLPKLGNYSIRKVVLDLDDGSVAHKLARVPNAELQAWDAKHDPAGHSLASSEELGTEYRIVEENKV